MSGFVKLDRDFFKHPFWNEAREYSKSEAWLDLLQMARFELSKEVINNKVIDVRKGEIPLSIRFLEKRWNWGNTKIRTFLKNLQKMGMTTQRTTQGQTVVRLINKDVSGKPNTEPTQQPTLNQHRANTEPTQIKEYKNIINIYTPEAFLKTWQEARMHWDKKPTNILKLNFIEQQNFNELLKDYEETEFREALNGLFFQKTLPAVRVRPAWLLKRENFENMRDCWVNKTKMYENAN